MYTPIPVEDEDGSDFDDIHDESHQRKWSQPPEVRCA